MKRVVKKYKLKEGVKTVGVIAILLIIVTCYLFIASDRVERIENNKNSYSERSISINFTR
jgi:predicted ABC-type sugar transport system permease subunit